MKLSGADHEALRILREVAQLALRKVTGEMISGGRTLKVRRAWDGLNVVERLLGDRSKSATLEENALVCLRVAKERGWSVAFEPDDAVRFYVHRAGATGTVVTERLLMSNDPTDVESSVHNALDTAERSMREEAYDA